MQTTGLRLGARNGASIYILALACLILLPVFDGYAYGQDPNDVPFCEPIDFSQVQSGGSEAAEKRAFSLNTGDPRTVRVIYFVPNDRSFSITVEDSIKRAVRQVRAFFADQMKAHGFDHNAINIETADDGEPLIHRVAGRHADDDYYDDDMHYAVFREIRQNYDTRANIYIAFIDNSRMFTPRGGRNGKTGGEASMGVDFDWQTVAHELGHGFGLHHDFRNDAYVMSYGVEPDSLSLCAAEFLSVHPYFNPQISIDHGFGPSVELISSRRFPQYAEDISVQFKVADTDGLHQAILFATTPTLNFGGGFPEIKAWRGLTKERTTVVDFEYERDALGIIQEPNLEKIYVNAVDTDGNLQLVSFNLVSVSPYHHATLEGHADRVVSVEFSPDGKILASASNDNTVRLWDAATGELLATLEHSNDVRSLSFSPDGKVLASASDDRTVKLWDTANHELIASLAGHLDVVDLVRFSPDGRVLASAAWDRTVKLWDVPNKEIAATLEHANSAHSLSFSPDGKILATASKDRTVKLWNVLDGELAATLEGHEDKVSSVAFSPDGKTLVTASQDRTVKLWDVADRELTATLEGHEDKVSTVMFSPDGKTLASASVDNSVTLWDAETGTRIAILGRCAFSPASLRFSPDGTIIAAGAAVGNAVAIWDAATGTSLSTFPHTGDVISLSFSPDGRFIASGSDDKKIEVWDLSSWALPRARTVTKVSGDDQEGTTGGLLANPFIVEVRDQYGEPISGARVTFAVVAGDGSLSNGFTIESGATGPDGRAQIVLRLGSIPGTNTVEVSIAELEVETFNAVALGTPGRHGIAFDYPAWHLPRGATVRLGKGSLGHSDRAIAFSPDGKALAVTSAIGVWLYTVDQPQAFNLLRSNITHSVSFSPDGATIAAGGGWESGEVILWDAATGTRTGRIGTDSWVKFLTYSPDGRTLAFGSSGPLIELWDVAARSQIGTLDGISSIGTSVAFSPDGITIASGYEDGKILLWDMTTRTNTTSLAEHRREVVSVAFSPDGSTLASASADGTVKLWDIETGTVSATIRGNRSQAECVAFSPDGGTLACGWSDRTVTLWNIGTETKTATFSRHRDWLSAVSFSPEGGTIASASEDGDVYLWDLATGNAIGILGHFGHTDSVWGLAFSPDGATLASHSGTTKGKINIWDVATGLKKVTLGGHASVVRSIAFSPDGTLLASASSDSTIRLWDLRTRSTIARFLHRSQLQSVSFSPDGATLAAGDFEGNVHLWDVKTEETLNIFTGLDDDVRKLLFSPDGATLAAGTQGGKIRLWDVATGATIRDLERQLRSVRSMAFSSDGATLATSSHQHSVKLWDLATGAAIATLNEGVFDCVAFSPDGSMFATGSQDQRVRLYDMSTGDIVATFEGHNHYVSSVSFTPDGKTLASGSNDGTILLWDLSPYHSFETPNPDFNADGAVGFADFILFAANFGQSRGDADYDARYDLDGDGQVGFSDFLIFAGDFGKTAGN